MLTLAKSGKKIVGIWGIVFTLAISTCFLFSLIKSQEAYAEKKKVSGTSKLVMQPATLIKSELFPSNCNSTVGVEGRLYVLNSTDPAWNNASLFCIFVTVEPIRDKNDYKSYAVITHPGGDQTFIESDGSWERKGGLNWAFESYGRFVGGTGEFEWINALWKYKGKGGVHSMIIGEWEVEYD